MHYKKSFVLLIILLVFTAGGLQAQPDVESVQQNIADRLAEENFLGISIAYIYPDGRTQYISRGSLTGARDESVDKSTIFEIGSISKTFTALMMMKMVEDGVFALHTSIETILPDSVNVPSYKGKKITLLDLATHTSGLPSLPNNFSPANPSNPYADYTIKQMYDFLDSYSLTKAPGSEFAYSNFGAGLLGHLLELASGKTYAQLLDEYITGVLNMNDTSIEVPARKQNRFAHAYNFGAQVDHWNFPTLTGAGGIRSTAKDMATYMKAQMGLQVSNLEIAIEKTHQIRFDTGSGNTDAIGLAWFYATKHDTIIWHNGGTGGFRSFAGFNKQNGTAVVVLINGKENIDDIGLHLLDESYPWTKIDSKRAVNSAPLDPYMGTYQHSSGARYYVSRKEHKLFVQISGQAAQRVFPRGKNRFFYKVVKAEIKFSKEESGEFQKLTLYQNGQEISANRISDETAPVQRKEVEVDNALLKRYIGTFIVAPGFDIKVTLQGNQLITQATGQKKFPVYPESQTKFFLKVVDAQLKFIPDDDGNFNTVKLYQAGRVLEGKRVEN